ncbi:MAG: hypothetical protein QF835_10865 [Candidatus Marinimicrobia bacterium]|jgi:hypothetical protein|nr:hypothetical protein [Candidatus Neomarinimicrobiota bacterium]MDP6615510.1 hypothetical protein [Candidatus Neomarinimicrobiota bacterium]|tara:strand:- start:5221 stop:5412 length:192 start_codon:yes stop_codon:yes gene_type:complete
MSFRRPRFIRVWLKLYREGGFTKLLKVKGWKIVLAFFLFYLIRDSIIYIILPYVAYTSLSTCF